MKLREIADLIGGKISGDPEVDITGASGIFDAGRGDITFLAEKRYSSAVRETGASAVILREEFKDLAANALVVNNPQYAFARVSELLYAGPRKPPVISKDAVIGNNVKLGDDVTVSPLSYLGDNVTVGSRATIHPGVHIGEGSSIGDDSVLYPNVTVYEGVKIGSRVIIHSGTVIGADGFGFVREEGRHHKIPQVGGVVVGDDVEIGANVTIDRATMKNTDTIVGAGTKIDNLVQIAHNVRIGKNCLIVAQVGISGSTEIGDDVILAGQAGVINHLKIGNGAIISAQSGVIRDIPEGQVYSGTPAIPHKTWLRAQNINSKLPEYIKRLQELERKMMKEGASNDG
jgi:UDP-3-O-[3-hydroxymyristoyl] glucosamine N-acyltransferase